MLTSASNPLESQSTTRRRFHLSHLSLIFCSVLALCGTAQADTGKLLLTGGVTGVDGAAGGGITPWAVIGTQATNGQMGFSTSLGQLSTQDYRLMTYGAAWGMNDRIELTIAHQDFDTGMTGTLLGIPGLHLRQNIVGAKYRVAGEAVLDSDNLMPQVAVGVQHKSLASSGLNSTLDSLGARRSGIDMYVSASKLLLSQGLLINATLRATKANQNGLLGFGATLGGANNSYELRPELSMAYLLRQDLAIGVEYRKMTNKLERAGRAAGLGNGLASDDWKDVFIAWAPSQHVSMTLAYVDLGRVVPATTNNRKQSGVYVAVQLAF